MTTRQHELFSALDKLIQHLGTLIGATQEEMEVFFLELQREAFAKGAHELLDAVEYAARRLWTSTKKLHGRELCSLMNEVIRRDDPTILPAVALIARCINTLCVTRHDEGLAIPYPADGLVYRGGGLPEKYQSFFRPEKVL